MTTIDLRTPFNTRIHVEQEDREAEVGRVAVDAKSEGPPLHVHADQHERWTVERGVLSARVAGKVVHLAAGESVDVPRGTPHTYWNENDEACEFRYTLSPGHRFTSMMRTFEALARDGKIRGTKDVRSIMHMAQVFVEFGDHVRAVAPPQWVMRSMAAIGRGLGIVKDVTPR